MRKHWGWGDVDRSLSTDQIRQAAPGIVEYLGFGRVEPEPAVPLRRARGGNMTLLVMYVKPNRL